MSGFTTGNAALDMELPLLTMNELDELAKYAGYLRWMRIQKEDDDSWADAPLTPEEEEGLRRGRENARNGHYLTLAEFIESQQIEKQLCGK